MLFTVRGFLPALRDQLVALYAGNTTALAYLKKQGGTRSQTLNSVAQTTLRLCEVHRIQLLPQFIPGKLNVLADFLSRKSQVLSSEWALCSESFPPASSSLASDDRSLRHVSEPLSASLLFTHGGSTVSGHGLYAPVVGWASGLCLSPLRPDPSGFSQGSAVPGSRAHLGGSVLDSTLLVPGPTGASGGDSLLPATKEGSSQTTAFPPLPPEPPRASADCVSFVR